MIKNFFITAWRNIWKNKFFSLINIIGLGLAIPFALLCLIQVQGAYEADNFHPYPDRSYRINTDVKDNGGSITKYALSPQQLAERLGKDYPLIQEVTYTIREYEWELNNRLKTLPVNTLYVEPSFFDMFGFHLLSGSRPIEPNSIAITSDKAVAFFGTDNVVGKTLSHPSYGNFIITGVLATMKRNTVFRTDVMVSMSTWKKFNKDTLPESLTGYTYVLMKPHTTGEQLDVAINSISTAMNKDAASLPKKETLTFHKQKVIDIAPAYEDLEGNAYVDSVRDLLLNFAFAVALLILATFNYINLTLARSVNRAKEVGLRKTVGALRYQLIIQFVCEAVMMALLSLGLGYVILKLLQRFSYVNWFIWEVDNPWLLWGLFLLFTVFIGAVAGFIPARILSRFKPVNVLKGNISPSALGKSGLRNSLVVIQFVASACFIFVLFTLINQFRYMATDNTNFNRENIYNIAAQDKLELLRHDILKNKNVVRVGFVSTPFGGSSAQALIKRNDQSTNVPANYFAADADFVTDMHLQIIAGNNLLPADGDSASDFVFVNQQLLTAIGLENPHDAIGKTFYMNDTHPVIIQGVLPDFCYENYQFAAKPLIIQNNPAQFRLLNIETKGKVDDALFKSEMNTIWKIYFPHDELAFSNYQKDLYESYFPGGDMKFMGMFCGVVLVIALLGLLGIVSYHTERRVKEIGIRKVMGASVNQIVKELSKSFVKLTLISASVALPLGYAICYMFMKLFVYSNGVNVWLLSALFGGIFSLAIIIILFKSLRAAMANPVKSLRTE